MFDTLRLICVPTIISVFTVILAGANVAAFDTDRHKFVNVITNRNTYKRPQEAQRHV